MTTDVPVATGSRVFTQGDFDRFAELSGDDNPIHVVQIDELKVEQPVFLL